MESDDIFPERKYSSELAEFESWLDEHPDFTHDYFVRKAPRSIIDSWLIQHSIGQTSNFIGAGGANGEGAIRALVNATVATTAVALHTDLGTSNSKATSGSTTPVRKISAQEFERISKPILSNIDGQPTFLTLPLPLDSKSGLTYRRSREELQALDERELLFELAKDICDELDTRTLAHKILQHVGVLTSADRASLFLVQGEKGSPGRCLVSTLFDVCSQSTLADMEKKEEIRVNWGSGIIGFVAETLEAVNIVDAYKDERFNQEIDKLTGYRTKTLLCMPIKDKRGEILGVAQVINKRNNGPFTIRDEEVFRNYLQFCGIGLGNAQLYQQSCLEVKRNQVLLDLAKMIFEEQSTIELMVYRILTHTLSLMQCQRAQVLLLHETSGTFSRVFDLEALDLKEDELQSRTSPFEGRFPINVGVTGYVATTGETLNLSNLYEDPRFDPSVDYGQNFTHRHILCMAIKNANGKIVGVIQLINKFDGSPFTTSDENFLEAFAIFCGMGINNTKMYEKAISAIAKQKVTLEVLSYHAIASEEEAKALQNTQVLSAQHYRLHSFEFDDNQLSDEDTCRVCLRMFLDLDLVKRFNFDYGTLCRWLLSVKKNYRKEVIYHNWRHAFNVCQMMYCTLTATEWWKVMGDIEVLGLIMACLCHDMDHRGTNNSFQLKASSPLAQLYSTSTMERHHFDQCLMVLNSEGNQLLCHLTADEYSRVVKILEDAILATDLAVYYRNRVEFMNLLDNHNYDWTRNEHRDLLRGMLMTACDLAAITKPWDVEKRVAELITSEFFGQGDIEREKLNIEPIDMMNREKKELLPTMQVTFIDSICYPIYEAFARLSPKLEPLLQGVKRNRENWTQIIASQQTYIYKNENGQ